MPPTDQQAAGGVRPLAPHEFEQIRQLAHRTFGLDLRSGKEELVSARLQRLLRAEGFRSFQEYYRHVLEDRTGIALAAMVDALATNHTAFLRERDHFDFLGEHAAELAEGRSSLEVWSAACSTGEEVWTLVCLLNDALPRHRIHITATDISNKALRIAANAEYAAERCQELPRAWLTRYFTAQGRSPASYQVAPAFRAQVTFRRVNLVERLVTPQRYAVIFCRNVMIYFDRQTQEQVVRKLADCIEPGGYLFVGHAEGLTGIEHTLQYVRPAIYRKPGKTGGRWNKSS